MLSRRWLPIAGYGLVIAQPCGDAKELLRRRMAVPDKGEAVLAFVLPCFPSDGRDGSGINCETRAK